MTNNTQHYTITRRQVLGGLGAVGLASAGAGLGTSAYFNDTESFDNNRITAWSHNLKVDWQQTYDGPADSPVYGTAGYPYVNAFPDTYRNDPSDPTKLDLSSGGPATETDGVQDPIRDRDQVEAGFSAFGTTATDQQIEDTFRAQFADVDGWESPLVDLTDAKPGDSGEVTFSLHLFDDDVFLGLIGHLLEDAENGRNEAEQADDSDDVGELADAVRVTFWYDDGNNLQDAVETLTIDSSGTTVDVPAEQAIIAEGRLRAVLDALASGIPLDANPLTPELECFPQELTRHIGFRWWIPKTVGNEIQSDGLRFELGYVSEQCRNNTQAPAVDIGPQVITASPSTPETTSTHTVRVVVDGAAAGEPLDSLAVDYPDGFSVASVAASDVITATIAGTSVSGDLNTVTGSDAATRVEFAFGGSHSLPDGGELVVTYTDVLNAEIGTYPVHVTVNPGGIEEPAVGTLRLVP